MLVEVDGQNFWIWFSVAMRTDWAKNYTIADLAHVLNDKNEMNLCKLLKNTSYSSSSLHHRAILAKDKVRYNLDQYFLSIDIVRIVSILFKVTIATTSCCTVTIYLHIDMSPSSTIIHGGKGIEHMNPGELTPHP